MNERIIRDYLLVSGSAQRPDGTRLDRMAGESGFQVGRTGRFGIGVLSYFMLAERVRITTNRSPIPGDGEAHGWIFDTRGVGSFGELRAATDLGSGTELILYLRKSVVQALREQLAERVGRWVAHAPCKLVVSVDGDVVLDTGPGYAFLPRRSGRGPEAESAVTWRTEDGTLPNGLGTYRLDVPVWDLDGVPVLAPIICRREGRDRVVAQKVRSPSMNFIVAWRGMAMPNDRRQPWAVTDAEWNSGDSIRDAALLVNLCSEKAGAISVDRGRFALTKEGSEAVVFAEQQLRRLKTSVAAETVESPWALLNHRLAGAPPPPQALDAWQWLLDMPLADRVARWGRIRFPVLRDLDTSASTGMALGFRGERLSVLPSLAVENRWREHRLPWHAPDWQPHLIASYRGRPIGIYVEPPDEHGKLGRSDRPIFPPEWLELAGVRIEERHDAEFMALNRDNALVMASHYMGRVSDLRSAFGLRGIPPDLDAVLERVRDDTKLMATWLLLALAGEAPSARERAAAQPRWWSEVWDQLGLPDATSILYWFNSHGIAGLQVLNRRSWQFRDVQDAGASFVERGRPRRRPRWASRVAGLTYGLPQVHMDWSVQRIL